MNRFKKNVLITGGSRGIGAGMVRGFAAAGYNVFFTYNSNVEKSIILQKEMAKEGYNVSGLKVELQNPSDIEKLFSTIESKEINILINNAAILSYCDFTKISFDLWDHTQAVNIRAPFLLSQKLLPKMIEAGWGRIINLTSIGGQWGGTLAVHYAVSKTALIGLTRSLAKLCAHGGVTVNAIAPGLVDTEIISGEKDTNEFKNKVANIPVGRIAEVDEIVKVAQFLASDEASYITGQTINVNGGMYFG